MKTAAVIGIAMLLAACPEAVFSLEVDAPIARVTVYGQAAMVTRQAEVTVPAGASELRLEGLTPSLMDDSVQVRGLGAGKTTIAGIAVETVFRENPRRQEVEKLETRLEVLQNRREELKKQLDALALQLAFLATVRPGEKSAALPSPEQLQGVLEFIGSSAGSIGEKTVALERDKEKVRKEIAAVEEELRQIQGPASSSRREKTVTVSIEADAPGLFKLELLYMVPGALWRPVYDARADLASGRVSLDCRAEVRQSSGENWAGVDLALSTARPLVGGTPPEPQPWYIRFLQPQVAAAAPGAMYAVRSRNLKSLGYSGAEEREETAADYDAAVAVETGAAVSFQVPRAQDIPSDGQFHGMMLVRRVFPGTFSYLAVPRLSESVYLQARFVNDGDAPYLPGEINVFNGDDFIGKSRFEGAIPGQESRLDLGIDDRVKVERTLSSEETRQGGLFRGDTAYREYAYLIKAENFTRASARIDVVDQIPVSQTAEIKVELDEIEPRPLSEWEGKGPGLLKWSLDVPPGASREISYKYSVSYPKDREIQGL